MENVDLVSLSNDGLGIDVSLEKALLWSLNVSSKLFRDLSVLSCVIRRSWSKFSASFNLEEASCKLCMLKG